MLVARRLTSLLFALSMIAALGLVRAPVAAAQDDSAGLDQMLARINQMRSAAGLGTLARDARLDAAARAHSADMAANDLLAHVSPRTGDPLARVAAAGLSNVQIAENIALNADVLAAHAALVTSDAHRANLMNAALTHIGLAAARSARGVYVTQVFAALPTASAPTQPAAELVAPVTAQPAPQVEAPQVAAPAELAVSAQVAAPQVAAPQVTAPPQSAPQLTAPQAAPPQVTAPQQVAVPAQPGARRVAGYWVFSRGRWWYYPLPADARPGQQLQAAQLPPGAAPPGYGTQAAPSTPLPVFAPPVAQAPQYAQPQYAPPQYAQPSTYYVAPAPAYGYVPPMYAPPVYLPPPPAYYAPGPRVRAPAFGWSPRRFPGRWRR